MGKNYDAGLDKRSKPDLTKTSKVRCREEGKKVKGPCMVTNVLYAKVCVV